MRWLLFCTCWTFLLGWTSRYVLVNAELVIIRKVNKKDVYHKDRFNIRRSKCTDIRQGNKCKIYGGFERSPSNPCKCHCPPRMGTMTQQNKKWRCTSNEELREREGCGFYFLYESSESFVRVLIGNKWQFFQAPHTGCAVNKVNTSYLSCNGSWVSIPNMVNHVDVIMRGFDQVARGYAYQIRVKKDRFLAGKLIKLYLNCSPFGGNPCLLIKMKGNQNCKCELRLITRTCIII
ncbi:hypothetical protein QZH41_016203 [Actinostola sp. cb2023]|nr:hypothetical protein QZH41_016203 [Actinostola sp. cb2023]